MIWIPMNSPNMSEYNINRDEYFWSPKEGSSEYLKTSEIVQGRYDLIALRFLGCMETEVNKVSEKRVK